MVAINDTLAAPLAGWKRYQIEYDAVKMTNTLYTATTGTGVSNASSYSFSTLLASAEFSFIGTKLVIRAWQGSNSTGGKLSISVDGEETIYTISGTPATYSVIYVKEGLENKRHSVIIKSLDTKAKWIDTIDIDDVGRLLHPDEVLTPEELQIGKRIRCHYRGTNGAVGTFYHLGKESYQDGINDFIPIKGSVTPNGDFYFIMVKPKSGKKILVADRNVQASLTWSAINDFGYATGYMLSATENQVPEMYSFKSTEGEVIYSTQSGAQPDVWNAFNSVTGLAGRAGLGSLPTYVGFHFNEPKVIQTYKLVPYSSNRNHDARTWEFQASNDGTNWDVLHSVAGEGANGATRTYSFTNTKAYTMYRWYVTAKNSGSWPDLWIDGLELIGYSEKTVNNKAIVRLMTNGISASYKGEWDEYLLDTDLNRLIPAGGNNAFWNIGTGLSTSENQHWTSTSASNSSSSRLTRSLSGQSNTSSTLSSTAHVFRPMMELMVFSENVGPVYVRKFLVNDGGVIKTFSADTLSWVTLGNEPATLTMFEDGLDNIGLIAPYLGDLASDTVKVLMTDTTPEMSQVRVIVDAVPKDVILKYNTDIDMSNAYAIDYINIRGVFNNGFRAAVSFDGGLTWMSKKNGTWTTLELNAETMTATGMTGAEFNVLNRFDWENNLQDARTIRFAFLFSIEQTDEVLSIDELVSQIDMHGRWMRDRNADWEYISNRNLKVFVYQDGDYKIIY